MHILSPTYTYVPCNTFTIRSKTFTYNHHPYLTYTSGIMYGLRPVFLRARGHNLRRSFKDRVGCNLVFSFRHYF